MWNLSMSRSNNPFGLVVTNYCIADVKSNKSPTVMTIRKMKTWSELHSNAQVYSSYLVNNSSVPYNK